MEFVLIILLYLMVAVIAGASPIYNVMAYGARGDGKTDDTKAFLNAWKAAFADPRNPYFVVTGKGGKNYLLSKVIFEGPCSSSLKFLISGGLVAPNRLWTNQIDTWIVFKNIPKITMLGNGLIDGKDFIWWDCLSKNGGAGHAKSISYENINFTSVKAGVIVIDQYYCPELNCPNKTGNVAISEVSYLGLQGSSVSDVAIKLACSSSMPCRDITMSDVSFTPQQANIRLQSYCINAQGSASGIVTPQTPYLQH